jgi:thioredoxin 1
MQELNENEYDAKVATGITLVDFSAEWCGPCKAILPTIEKLANEYKGRVGVYSIDIDKSPRIAARSGVMSVPTLILYKQGKVVDRVVGAVSERDLRKRIEEQLS